MVNRSIIVQCNMTTHKGVMMTDSNTTQNAAKESAEDKAYAAAVAAKTDTAKKADVKAEEAKTETAPKADAVKVEAKAEAAPAAQTAKAPVKKIAAKKAAPKKSTPVKAAKTAATKNTKTAAKTTTPKTVAKKAAPKSTTRKSTQSKIKDTTMATTKKVTEEGKKAAEAMTERLQNMFGDFSSKAKEAFEKGNEYVSQAVEFNKANLEAVVESGKIAAKGAQEMGQDYAADTRKNFEELTASFKEFASVKSPTEFMQLQTEMVRKSFDTAVAQASKNSEAFLKLAGDVAQPLSNRVSVAVESVKKSA